MSPAQLRDSVTHVHTSVLFPSPFPPRLSRNMGWRSLRCTAGPHWAVIASPAVRRRRQPQPPEEATDQEMAPFPENRGQGNRTSTCLGLAPISSVQEMVGPLTRESDAEAETERGREGKGETRWVRRADGRGGLKLRRCNVEEHTRPLRLCRGLGPQRSQQRTDNGKDLSSFYSGAQAPTSRGGGKFQSIQSCL